MTGIQRNYDVVSGTPATIYDPTGQTGMTVGIVSLILTCLGATKANATLTENGIVRSRFVVGASSTQAFPGINAKFSGLIAILSDQPISVGVTLDAPG